MDKNMSEPITADELQQSEAVVTFGMRAVGINFNPSGDAAVHECKMGFANEIDRMNELRVRTTSSGQERLASVAITEMQTAQMWAVKALTWRT